MPTRLLCVIAPEFDQEPGLLKANEFQNELKRLPGGDWQVEVVPSFNEVTDLVLEDLDPHVILVAGQLNGSAKTAIETISQELDKPCEWVFIQWPESKVLDQSIQRLAYEICSSKASASRLVSVLSRAARDAITQRRLLKYATQERDRYHLEAFIGQSQPVQEVKELIKRLIEVPISSMLILGETGTGKGLVARIIHHNGPRSGEAMVELNCAALPKDLLESQLFGHEAGAFTHAQSRYRGLFEQADGGTLFLDEIGDLDLELQAKILKAIEDKQIRRLGAEREKSVDVQIIAATSIDLERAIAQGQFREELYHRLSVFRVTLPPLRNRTEDLLELVPPMVAEFNQKAGKRVSDIPENVWQQLQSYDWPGNIRELRNVIERCVLLAKDSTLPQKWLQLDSGRVAEKEDAGDKSAVANSDPHSVQLPLDGSLSLDQMEARIIERALIMHDNNVTQAADLLGVSRDTLRYRIAKHQLSTQ